MARKILLDIDPGVADALALCLALGDHRLEVVALTATGGNVPAADATRNVQALVEQLDPWRLPRIGAADPDQPLRTDGRALSGPDGLCGANLNVAELHHRHPSPKVIADEIRAAPGEVTLIACGPLSNIATVLQRDPELATQIGHLIMVGGTSSGPGNVTAAAEFNIYCDAEAAQLVFRSPVTKTLLPLDVTSQVVLNIGLLSHLPDVPGGLGNVLRSIVPGAFRAHHQRLGLEGIFVHEVVAIVSVLHPELFTTERKHCEVETTGDLTYGATVIDRRQTSEGQPNMDVVVELNAEAVVDCILRGLQKK